MIHIQLARHGLVAIACTVNDHLIVTASIGLTKRHAERRLLRRLDRQWRVLDQLGESR